MPLPPSPAPRAGSHRGLRTAVTARREVLQQRLLAEASGGADRLEQARCQDVIRRVCPCLELGKCVVSRSCRGHSGGPSLRQAARERLRPQPTGAPGCARRRDGYATQNPSGRVTCGAACGARPSKVRVEGSRRRFRNRCTVHCLGPPSRTTPPTAAGGCAGRCRGSAVPCRLGTVPRPSGRSTDVLRWADRPAPVNSGRE